MTMKMAKIKYRETIKSSQGKEKRKKSYIQRLRDEFSAETLQDRKWHDIYNDEKGIPTAESTQQGSHSFQGRMTPYQICLL